MTFVLSALLAFCMMGCARVDETRDDLAAVPPPEIEPATTPELPRSFPTPKGFVNDFANILNSTAERDLETKLSAASSDGIVEP